MKRQLLVPALLLALSAMPQILPGTTFGDFEIVPQWEFLDLTRTAPLAYGNQQYEEAFAKFQRLACAGDKAGQASLGKMYLTGKGTSRNDLNGYLWIKVASEYDFPPYRILAREIEAQLTPRELRLTAVRAEELRQHYGLRATNMSCNESSSSSFNSNLKDAIICTPERQSSIFLLHRCVGLEK